MWPLLAAVIGFGVCAILALLSWNLWLRARRSERAARLAVERRDRFLVEAASELSAPLDQLKTELELASLLPAEKRAELLQSVDQLRALVAELARLPHRAPEHREPVDVAELVREVLAAPPFADRGPSVILRARPARVIGDRARLLNGLRVLLWVVRRDVDELVITVGGEEDQARVEIDTRGSRAAVDALERMPAVMYGTRQNTASPGTTLALKVASDVARAHGGRVRASARPGRGERFVLELPASAVALQNL